MRTIEKTNQEPRNDSSVTDEGFGNGSRAGTLRKDTRYVQGLRSRHEIGKVFWPCCRPLHALLALLAVQEGVQIHGSLEPRNEALSHGATESGIQGEKISSVIMSERTSSGRIEAW